MTPGSWTTSTSLRTSSASRPRQTSSLAIKARGTSRSGACLWIRGRIAVRAPCRQRARSQRARVRLPVAGAGRRRFRQNELAPLLRMNQRQARALEGERIVRREEVIFVIPVLGDPERPSNALDPRPPGVIEADKLTSFEVELGAIETDVHGRLL